MYTGKVHHINVNESDIMGNGFHGRVVIIPGSNARAKLLSSYWDDVESIEHPRGHNFYKGKWNIDGKSIDVAAISTGMGTPSLDIVVNELKSVGCRIFIRLGTSGSINKKNTRSGDVVLALAAVRDESTSRAYIPTEFPAIASTEFIHSGLEVVRNQYSNFSVSLGIVHSKDSLMAREFHIGPLKDENKRYMDIMKESGVLVSEMETSHLYILGSLFNTECHTKKYVVGSVLAVIGDDTPFCDDISVENMEKNAITVLRDVIMNLMDCI